MGLGSRRWTRGQSAVLVAGIAVTLLGIAGAQLSAARWTALFDNVHWTAAYLTAALVAALGWRDAAADVRDERALFAATLGAYALGQLAWDVQVAAGWNPFPGPSDALFVLLGPGLLAGLLLRTRELSSAARRSIVLSATGVIAAILAYVLVLYLPRRADRDLLTTCVLVAYPTLTLGATAFGVVLVLEQQLKPSPALLVFLAAVGANGVLWMEWNSRTLDGTLEDGTLFNDLFSITSIAQGIGAALWQPRTSTNALYRRACSVATRSLPLVLVLGAAIAIALSQRIPESAIGAVQVCVGVVIVAAAGCQTLLLGEREKMLRAEARTRELESRVAHSQRLESLGTLAGGIAHDFNNILMAVYGHALLLDRRLPREGALRDALSNVLRGCERGRDVSRRVLAFARHTEARRSAIELREVVDEALGLLRAALPVSLELRVDACDDACWIEADAAQMQCVIFHLATNAADAIGARHGRVRFALTRRDETAAETIERSTHGYVELTVEDDGSGMDEATRLRAFEPFFTTKSVDQGTGLGLSVVHGVVLAHGGAIELDSARGKGTRVRITLPALADAAARSDAELARSSAATAQAELAAARGTLRADATHAETPSAVNARVPRVEPETTVAGSTTATDATDSLTTSMTAATLLPKARLAPREAPRDARTDVRRDAHATAESRAHAAADPAHAHDAGDTVARAESSDGKHVLIVDDEELVAPMLAKLVQHLGWVPTFELCPARALQRVVEDPARFAVVITDRTMPGMSGLELARELRRVAPNLPIVLSSGDVRATADAALFTDVLHKPYGLAQLAKTLETATRRAHDAEPSAARAA